MFINKVITYKDAWNIVNKNHGLELNEIITSLSRFNEVYEVLKREKGNNRFISTREIWESILTENGWIVPDHVISVKNSRLRLRGLGPIKNGVSASLTFNSFDFLNRWLFNQTTLAIRNNIIEIPILLLANSEYHKGFEQRQVLSNSTIEVTQRELELLSPLSHAYPFLILGFTDNDNEDLEIIELKSDPLVGEENKIIDRCIEFPSEYHQAGLNILNFFGTYLREQYPNENAKVKIEQNGLIVRLIIESNDGRSEVIEKALHEYQLIVSGSQKIEDIIHDERLILEMRNELRIAKFRIESQQDIIGVQNSRIDKLLQIVEVGLSNKTPVLIDFRPTITTTSNINLNQDISYVLNDIGELKQLLPMGSSAFIMLKELEGSMEAVEKEKNPDVIKNSPAMGKFKKFIDKVSDNNSDVNKVIKAAEHGWDLFQNLAGKYNNIAEWCGLPQVPKIFTK